MAIDVLKQKHECNFNPEILESLDIDLKRSLMEYCVENRDLLLAKLKMNAISLESNEMIITLFSVDDFFKLETWLEEKIS